MKVYDILNKLILRFKGGGRLSLKPLIGLVINDDIEGGESGDGGNYSVDFTEYLVNFPKFKFGVRIDGKWFVYDNLQDAINASRYEGGLILALYEKDISTIFNEEGFDEYTDNFVYQFYVIDDGDKINANFEYVQFQIFEAGSFEEKEVIINGKTYYYYEVNFG